MTQTSSNFATVAGLWFAASHPDGGALVFVPTSFEDPETGEIEFTIQVIRTYPDAPNDSAVNLVTVDHHLAGFVAPHINEDGSFTLAVTGGGDTQIRTYGFGADLDLISGPDFVGTDGPYMGSSSTSIWRESISLSDGRTVVADPDGELRLLDHQYLQVGAVTGLGDMRSIDLAEARDGGLLLANSVEHGLEVRHFEITDTGISGPLRTEILDIDVGFRDPEITAVDGGYVVVSSTRDLGELSTSEDNEDTIVVTFVPDETGQPQEIDRFSYDEHLLGMATEVVTLPDGSFAISIHSGPYGIGGDMYLRHYAADGNFLRETQIHQGLGTSNNGAPIYSLTALADGSLFVNWQTPTAAGGRYGDVLFDVIAPRDFSDLSDVIPGATPIVADHPDGGVIMFTRISERDAESGLYDTTIQMVRVNADGSTDAPLVLINGSGNYSATSLFVPPHISEDGSFTLAVTSADSTDILTYRFIADGSLLDGPIQIDLPAPIRGSSIFSIVQESIALSDGRLAIVDPDGQLHLLDENHNLIDTVSGLGSLSKFDLAETADGNLLLVSKDGNSLEVFYFDVTANGISGPVHHDVLDIETGYRDPEITAVDGGYVVVNSIRNFVEEIGQNVDVIVLTHVSIETGEVRQIDSFTYNSDSNYIQFSNSIETLPDGTFAVLVGAPDFEMYVRRYAADGVYLGETAVPQGTDAAGNNGGYAHQMAVTADGSLFVTWMVEMRDEDGNYIGDGHDSFMIAPDDFGNDPSDTNTIDLADLVAPVPISGTDAADTLIGTADDDTILGLLGDDVLYGGHGHDQLVDFTTEDAPTSGGDDTLFGGQGNDSIQSGSGDDFLFGGSGDDGIAETGGVNSVYGGTGNDLVFSENGAGSLFGGSGEDSVYSREGANELYGGAGNDTLADFDGDGTIFGGQGEDVFIGTLGYGGAGADTILGETDFASTLYAGLGDDVIYGGDQGDELRGAAGNDLIYGGREGNDLLIGGQGDDQLFGKEGHDTLVGGQGADILDGDAGRDALVGAHGVDTIFGGAGNDRLSGGGAKDEIFGGNGHDILVGGFGDDTLDGGIGDDKFKGTAGDDLLTGGTGSDIFIFTPNFGADTISDFDAFDSAEDIHLRKVTQITDYVDLAENHMTQVGADVVINDGNGNTITILNVNIADLGADDFTF